LRQFGLAAAASPVPKRRRHRFVLSIVVNKLLRTTRLFSRIMSWPTSKISGAALEPASLNSRRQVVLATAVHISAAGPRTRRSESTNWVHDSRCETTVTVGRRLMEVVARGHFGGIF
jgi:hypothetical protein